MAPDLSDTAGALAAQVHETHTGLVLLVGDRAYKCKKPVVTDFLDFSTVELREQACTRELTLNGRLSPQAYLGIAHLDGPQPGTREPVLVMRRYPDAQRLSTRVNDPEIDAAALAGEITSVACILADFHAEGHRGIEVDAEATPAAVARRWSANITEMRPFTTAVLSAGLLDEVAALVQQYVDGRAALFIGRIDERRIVDGHADLLAGDIFCTADGPVLLDCLDFDDRLRYVDGLDDAAFLAMDLEFLGRGELAAQFLTDYRERAADTAPASLADFYVAYRAGVRAKVDCIRVAQGHPEAADDAARHLHIAADHLRAATIRLVLVGGGPGTGKTTVSRGVAENIGAQVISTDDVRRDLVDQQVICGAVGIVEQGLYAPENVATVYDEVLRRAQALLAGGWSVVLDGTWRDDAQRRCVRELAAQSHAALTELQCVTTLADAQDRIAARTVTTSDATPDIAAALAAGTGTGSDGWREAHLLDTGRAAATVVGEATELCTR
ncbi:MAG TPA: AAA family ATPase [Mycobacterium sp.]|nr:AAA family ATPase [Mycobacterium sp.]